MGLFSKKSKKTSNPSDSEPPQDFSESSKPYVIPVFVVNARVDGVNDDIENLQPDQKNGKLPEYESEIDYNVNKLVDNYGLGGMSGGMSCPKIPEFSPRVKKPKKDKPPKYPV